MSIDGKWIRDNETKEFSEGPFIEEQKRAQKKEMFDNMVSNGFNREYAYQIVYGLSSEDAKDIVANETYKNLIECGIPEEMARKMAYKNEESSLKTR